MTAAAATAETMPAPAEEEVIYVAHDQVDESKTNPRRHFDQVKLGELAESMKKVGVLQPILVRPHPTKPGKYEVVFGARRFRASKLAGLKKVPAIVRQLTDVQVLEAQVIENLQREDVHPLEEADGYAQLMEKHGYTADTLAAKVGKSKAYVYARLKLRALGKGTREMFFDGKLNASTALLVARIPDEKLQAKAAKEITASHYGEGPMSYRDAARHVQHNFMLRLADAPFDTKSTSLVPTAGACGTCPHRTGNQRDLFGEVKEADDLCTNPPCFDLKKDTAWNAKAQTAKKMGLRVLSEKEAKPSLFHGYQANGEYARIDQEPAGLWKKYSELLPKGKRPPPAAIARDDRGTVIELFKKADLDKAVKATGVKTKPMPSYAQPRRPAVDQIRMRAVAEGRRRAMAGVVAFLEKGRVSRAALEAIALCAIRAAWADTSAEVAQRRGLERKKQGPQLGMRGVWEDPLNQAAAKMTDAQLLGLIGELLATQTRLNHQFRGVGELFKAAKVDPKKIEAATLAEMRAAAKAKAKKSPSKKGAKKPAKAKA